MAISQITKVRPPARAHEVKVDGRARPSLLLTPGQYPFPLQTSDLSFLSSSQLPWGLEPLKESGFDGPDGCMLIQSLGRGWAPGPLASLYPVLLFCNMTAFTDHFYLCFLLFAAQQEIAAPPTRDSKGNIASTLLFLQAGG